MGGPQVQPPVGAAGAAGAAVSAERGAGDTRVELHGDGLVDDVVVRARWFSLRRRGLARYELELVPRLGRVEMARVGPSGAYVAADLCARFQRGIPSALPDCEFANQVRRLQFMLRQCPLAAIVFNTVCRLLHVRMSLATAGRPGRDGTA